jgi:hypothetical protein
MNHNNNDIMNHNNDIIYHNDNHNKHIFIHDNLHFNIHDFTSPLFDSFPHSFQTLPHTIFLSRPISIQFIHFVLFTIWFLYKLNFPYSFVSTIDFHLLFHSFKHIPFHSLLFHIRSHPHFSFSL